MRRTVLYVVLVSAWAVTCLAQAQGYLPDLTKMSLEELLELEIVTSTRNVKKLRDAPASAAIITASDIEEYGYRTLDEALRSVTGLYVTNDRNYTYLGVRGFLIPGDYSNRVLLLVDGYRVNDPAYHSPTLGYLLPVPMEAVKQIEVVKGPGSALYGSDALLATINIITKDGADLSATAVKGEGGNKSTSRSVLSYGKKLSPQSDVVASGLFYQTNGDAVVKSPGIADIHGADAEQSYLGFGKFRYGDLTLSVSGSHRIKDVPTGSFSTLTQKGTSTLDEYVFTNLRYDHAFDSTKNLSVSTSYNTYDYDGHYLIAGPLDSRDQLRSSWSRSELQFQWDTATRNRVMLGGTYDRAFKVRQRVFDAASGDTLNINTPTWSWGVFVQDQLSVTPDLDLVLGSRFDEYRDSDNAATYRAAAVYRPVKDTTLKLLFGTASRGPTLYELFYADGATLVANPRLKRETITTYEAEIVQRLPGGIEGTLSVYKYKFRDLLSQVGIGGGQLQYQNIGSSKAKGLEIDLRKRWSSGLALHLGGIFQKARDGNGATRTNSPYSILNIGVVAPIFSKRHTLALDLQYLSSRKTLLGGDTGESSVTAINFRSRDVFGVKRLDFTAAANNLFDERAFIPGGNEHRQNLIPSPTRTFLFGLEFRF